MISLAHELFMSEHYTLTLNEKVGFIIPTTRYRNNSILCGALHSGTEKLDFQCGVELWASRGIKGSGTGLTFDPLRLLSDLIESKKYPSRTNTQ